MQRSSIFRICQNCARQWDIPLNRQFPKPALHRHFSSTQPRRKIPEPEINYYEQTTPSKKSIRRISEAEFNDEDVAEQIKTHIKALEYQLRILESGKDWDELSPQDRALIQKASDGHAFSSDEIQKLLEGDDNAAKSARALGIDPDELDLGGLEFALPSAQQSSLEKLTRLLQEVSIDHKNTKKNKNLWQQYLSCKNQLPGFQSQLPKKAWNTLWHALQQDQIDANEDSRSKHLALLADDIVTSGIELTAAQKLARIQGYVTGGKHAEALKLWEEARKELQANKELSRAFRNLGPTIFAALQRPSDAQALALEFGNDSPHVNTFLPAIESWLQQGTKMGNGKAWWLYLKLRELMKATITPDDYDRLVMTFFKNGQLQLALAVFKDLVVAGRNSEADSLEMKKMSGLILNELANQSRDTEEVNTLSLTSLAVLPRSFQNKFFYAMWMKRLLGLREIEAAASVLELMYLRGVRADPRHINGLINALLRRGRPENKKLGRPGDKELALETGWAMIRERLKFVSQRRAVNSGQDPPPVPNDPSRHLPPYLGKNLPPATIETFCIIFLYYSRSNMPSSIDRLHSALTEAEIKPDIFYFNHMLYMHLRRGNRSKLWELFLTGTGSHQPSITTSEPTAYITPDMSTFICLWEAEKAHVTANPSVRKDQFTQVGVQFPGARKLFSRMTRWLRALSPEARSKAGSQFTHDLYTLILRSFSLTRDLPGTLIVLYALRDLFGHYPTAEDVRLVSIQLARSSEPSRGGWKTRRVTRFGDNKGSQLQLQKVADVLHIMEREREGKLSAMGVGKNELNEEMKGEEGLWLLAALIKAVMEGKREAGSLKTGGEEGREPGELWEEVEKVAWTMGVGGLNVGAPLYTKLDGVVEMTGFEGEALREAPEGEEWEEN